jgi:hypothetical protein
MTVAALSARDPKKSHHKKKTTDAPRSHHKKKGAVVKVPGPAGPAASSNLFDMLGGGTVAVSGPDTVLETQRHAVLHLTEGGEPSISFHVSRVVVSVGLSESMQQHVPTHLLANAVISLMAPPSMTPEQWSAIAWAHPTLHATLDRIGGVTSLVSLSVLDARGAVAVCYYRGVAEAAVPVAARRVSPVPEPDVMLGELAVCVCALAEHAHAARQASDLESLIDCLASS